MLFLFDGFLNPRNGPFHVWKQFWIVKMTLVRVKKELCVLGGANTPVVQQMSVEGCIA